MVKSGKRTPADAARLFSVNPSTVSRLLAVARHDPMIGAGAGNSRKKAKAR